MGITYLYPSQRREWFTHPYYSGDLRHQLALHYACWLVSTAPMRWWYLWYGPISLETGLVALLADRSYFRFIDIFSFRRESFGSCLLPPLRFRQQ